MGFPGISKVACGGEGIIGQEMVFGSAGVGIMAGRSTRRNTANNTNPPNEIVDEVARKLNTAFPNLLTQLVQALGGNRVNQREATPSCSIKTFRASGAKEFFGTKAPEIKAHVTSSQPATIQGSVSMANCLTTDGIKDGIFKKKENIGNKKRSNDQNRNRRRDDRNKRQRTGNNFAMTTPDQGQGQQQYVGQHPRKYPLIRFTLEQILNNVRLEVAEESEMSLELLSFGVGVVEDLKEIFKGLLLLVEDLMLENVAAVEEITLSNYS
nr:hypothetical protein [Tanacetum cinerariifolium]